MYRESDVVYRYDGSFEGFLCCVFESVYQKELPFAILTLDCDTTTLFSEKEISTDLAKARRVKASFAKKLGKSAPSCIAHAFLSCNPEKELLILRFLLFGYTKGPGVLSMSGHPDVAPMLAMEKQVTHEAHQLTGFLRFCDYGEFLGSTITPKNYVLPLLRLHFCQRYPSEDFLIYDKTHNAALLYVNGTTEYIALDEPPIFPELSPQEQAYQTLWKQFYNTISISARENLACRQTHCPKRYWINMTELADEL